MSISKLMNHKEICKNIVNVFEEVVDLKNTSFPKNDNLFYEMLEHISKIKDKSYISLKNLSIEDISFFMHILFHLKKPPSLKVVMVKGFYHKNRYIC